MFGTLGVFVEGSKSARTLKSFGYFTKVKLEVLRGHVTIPKIDNSQELHLSFVSDSLVNKIRLSRGQVQELFSLITC